MAVDVLNRFVSCRSGGWGRAQRGSGDLRRLWRCSFCAALYFVCAFGLTANSLYAQARGELANSPSEQRQELDSLVQLLGSGDFYARERAMQQIERLGLAAFDALSAAEEHADPEVSSRAKVLLQKISVDFVRDSDPRGVRELMRDYRQQTRSDREATIAQLADLPQNHGVAALARIARYESSPYLARLAAVRLLQDVTVNSADWETQRRAIAGELGTSDRIAVTWLRLHVAENPVSTDVTELLASGQSWVEEAKQERSRATSSSGDVFTEVSSSEILTALYEHAGWQFARAAELDAARRAELIEATNTMIAAADDSVPRLLRLMQWIQIHKLSESLVVFGQRFQEPLESHPLLASVYAARVEALGTAAAAEQAWSAAANVRQFTPRELGYYPQEADLPAIYFAYKLDKEGAREAARRDYRKIIDEMPAGEFEALQARMLLSESLGEEGRFAEAAELMQHAADAMWHNERRGRRAWGVSGPKPAEVQSRAEYFAALAYKDNDEDKYLALLQQSMFTDESNPDGLIELYNRQGNTPQQLAAVRTKILHALSIHQQRTIEEPNDDNAHNLWAWLAAKTFGDPAEALQHSMISLKLSPNSASYFDTMAACFAAQENYVEAVRCQQRAVNGDPLTQKLRRRLAAYREQLEAASRETPPSGDSP